MKGNNQICLTVWLYIDCITIHWLYSVYNGYSLLHIFRGMNFVKKKNSNSYERTENIFSRETKLHKIYGTDFEFVKVGDNLLWKLHVMVS